MVAVTGADRLCAKWGISRDAEAEAFVRELRNWPGVTLNYDARAERVDFHVPCGYTGGPGAKRRAWDTYLRRFWALRHRLQPFIAALHFERVLPGGPHREFVLSASRMFPGSVVLPRGRR